MLPAGGELAASVFIQIGVSGGKHKRGHHRIQLSVVNEHILPEVANAKRYLFPIVNSCTQ